MIMYVYLYNMELYFKIMCIFFKWWLIAGWWLTYPSEKYESQLGLWNSQYVYGKIKNVPNQQPVYIISTNIQI